MYIKLEWHTHQYCLQRYSPSFLLLVWSSECINLLIWSYLALPPTLLQDAMLYTSYHDMYTKHHSSQCGAHSDSSPLWRTRLGPHTWNPPWLTDQRPAWWCTPWACEEAGTRRHSSVPASREGGPMREWSSMSCEGSQTKSPPSVPPALQCGHATPGH